MGLLSGDWSIKLAEQFQISQSDTIFPQSDTFPQSDAPLFKFAEISVQFVNDQLQHLDIDKAIGVDSINARLLKDAAHLVSEPLAKSMNSLRLAELPQTGRKHALHQY